MTPDQLGLHDTLLDARGQHYALSKAIDETVLELVEALRWGFFGFGRVRRLRESIRLMLLRKAELSAHIQALMVVHLSETAREAKRFEELRLGEGARREKAA